MASESPLANTWRGLRRDVAPHQLDASESPDCLNCEPYLGRTGVLGPRRGRVRQYNTTSPIRGVGSFNFAAVGRGRVIATADGNWTVSGQSWPSTITPSNANWDRLSISNLTATQTDVGSTNGAQKTFTEINLANYGKAVIKFNSSTLLNWGPAMTTGTAKLQALIGGVWTDWYTWTIAAGTVQVSHSQATIAVTGALTGVRCQATIATESGSATLTLTVYCDVYLIRGAEGTVYTAA